MDYSWWDFLLRNKDRRRVNTDYVDRELKFVDKVEAKICVLRVKERRIFHEYKNKGSWSRWTRKDRQNIGLMTLDRSLVDRCAAAVLVCGYVTAFTFSTRR